MNKSMAIAAITAATGALVFATPSAAAPPTKSLEVYVADGTPTHVDELEPGLGPGDWLLFRDPVLDASGAQIGTADTRVQVVADAGEGDFSFILDCTVELDSGRLVFSGAERFSNLAIAVNFALVGGTGSYSGIEGQVTGEPATAGGRPATHMTFKVTRK